jgi:hypothetical protein
VLQCNQLRAAGLASVHSLNMVEARALVAPSENRLPNGMRGGIVGESTVVDLTMTDSDESTDDQESVDLADHDMQMEEDGDEGYIKGHVDQSAAVNMQVDDWVVVDPITEVNDQSVGVGGQDLCEDSDFPMISEASENVEGFVNTRGFALFSHTDALPLRIRAET